MRLGYPATRAENVTATAFFPRFHRMQSAEEPQAHVRMGEDRRGRPALVFSFPFDELLDSAVKRLPGRWVKWATREGAGVCRPESAEEIAEMLACFPRVAVAPDVSDWLADAAGWEG